MKSSFKVIIVGGGPVGLTAAHALQHAGIDFVVLERRSSIYDDVGASLVLRPSSLRVMHQLGLLDKLRSIGTAIHTGGSFTAEGFKFRRGDEVFPAIQANLGTLPPASTQASASPTSPPSSDAPDAPAPARVTCADGSIYEGDLVLGADGVHSIVRRIMRAQLLASDPAPAPASADIDPENPFTTYYRTMWFSFPAPRLASRAPPPTPTPTKLDHPTTERRSYSEQERAQYWRLFRDLAVTDKYKVGDLYPTRYSDGMANLEEGVLRRWHHGRIVLAGDACHKATPNLGLGFNNGLQDVVALVNRLHPLLSSPSLAPEHADAKPDAQALDVALAGYQTARMLLAPDDHYISSVVTRLWAWHNTIYWFLDRYLLPILPGMDAWVANASAQAECKGEVLDYIPADEPFVGKVPWVHAMPSLVAKDSA
ncbi:unnamed protein product [Parascedosporium putredinis]|uniref:FAD-binding domain-containing protein n=1 Tax=Parascedosporium putredinis TaxID=1442378 RepID=A0A9P1MBX5_9PEZI|nr:unnamed protein product [Parascedosporium putredinis]CAI7999558.1 unnamed protein product [Parascedosporium putredinis]